jgi:exopolysaccharide biosynthesis polyprenyl glycosylphosphotransferase
MRMSQTPDIKPEAVTSPAASERRPVPPRREGHGPDESRRRGALLRRLLAVGDWGALLAVLCVVTATSSSTDVADLFWAVLFSPAWVIVVKLQGLYDNDHRRIRHSTLDELPSLVTATVLATLVLDGMMAISPAGPLSPASAIGVGVGTFLLSFALRGVIRFLWHHLTGQATGIVIGPARSVDTVARRVSTHPETRLALVGYLAPKDEAEAKELPRLGSPADISRIAREHAIERVVVAEGQMSEVDAEHLIEECKDEGLALTFLPQHYGLLGPGIELNRLAELPVLDFRFSDPPRSTMAMKRAMDVFVSALLLVALSPLLAGIALWILLDDGRPVFFRQRRVGKEGALFTMVKFRTMVTDAEQLLPELVDIASLEQPAFKIPDDPRVTRSGRWLRRTSVDELPQLWNVLRGQMALVGPRPEEESVVALYDERQRGRLAVKPGMTGPMQVYGRSDLTFEERLAMERDYLDNVSLLTDLALLMRTPRAMVRGEGAY